MQNLECQNTAVKEAAGESCSTRLQPKGEFKKRRSKKEDSDAREIKLSQEEGSQSIHMLKYREEEEEGGGETGNSFQS